MFQKINKNKNFIINKLYCDFKNVKNRGFTLLETLVAIFILSVAITALISATASGISSVTFAKERITAGQLAQENIEMVRNIRDTLSLYTTGGWSVFLDEIVSPCTNSYCYIDTEFDLNASVNGIVNKCDPANPNELIGCPFLRYNDFNGSYTNVGGGKETIYRRGIKITTLSKDEVMITSVVSWHHGTKIRSVVMTENLFNWILQIPTL